jgi:hypothetical protein
VEWVVVHKESGLVKEKQEDSLKEQHVLYAKQRVNGVWCLERYVERICVGYGRPGEDRCGTTKVYQVSPEVFDQVEVGQVVERDVLQTKLIPVIKEDRQ